MISCSSTRHSHRMRCGVERCRQRFRKKRPPEQYAHWPKCPACGSINTRSIESERLREASKQRTCRCVAYPFPHREGSLRFCEWHIRVIAGIEPTEEEALDYESCLRTKRQGA